MDERAIQDYVTGFGRRFLYEDVLDKFPETKMVPAFLKQHFANAEIVLDLGFGTGTLQWHFVKRMGREAHDEAQKKRALLHECLERGSSQF